jgi:hypothetical protein
VYAIDETALLDGLRLRQQLRDEQAQGVHGLTKVVARCCQKVRISRCWRGRARGCAPRLLLQLFMRPADGLGHGVELIREHLELVARVDPHA